MLSELVQGLSFRPWNVNCWKWCFLQFRIPLVIVRKYWGCVLYGQYIDVVIHSDMDTSSLTYPSNSQFQHLVLTPFFQGVLSHEYSFTPVPIHWTCTLQSDWVRHECKYDQLDSQGPKVWPWASFARHENESTYSDPCLRLLHRYKWMSHEHATYHVI